LSVSAQSPVNDRARRKRAQRLAREVSRLLRKQRKRLNDKQVAGLEQSLEGLEQALQRDSGIESAADAVERQAQASLGYAQKGTTREYAESLVVAVLIALFLRAFVIEAFKIPTSSMVPTLLVGDHIFVNKFIYGLRVPFSNRWFVEWAEPERGEIVVFRFPDNQDQDFIKRVVAVAGDRIHVEGRDVYVNGQPLAREELEGVSYLEEGEDGPMRGSHQADAYRETAQGDGPTYTVLYEDGRYREPWPFATDEPGISCDPPSAPEPHACTVEEGHFFVMGDNRDNSLDSRSWGAVPRALVKGRAMFVWFSWGPRSGLRWTRFGHSVQ